jgi:hypothetical protein
MSNKTKKTIFCLLAVAAGALALKILAQVTCTLSTGSFSENFSTVTFKDSNNTAVYGWTPDTGQGSPLELPRLGANFAVTKPGGLGAHIYVTDSADFDGDGYPDLVGLELTGSSSYQDTSRLVYLKNKYKTAGAASWVMDTSVLNDPYTTYVGPASIVVGDFNGDGLFDFFFMRNGADEFGYTNFSAVMYINVGTKTAPKFNVRTNSSNLDFTSAFQTAKIYANWTANHLCAVDIDKDGDVDILAISQDKIFLIRNPGKLNFALSKFQISELSYNQNTGFAATGTVKGTDNNNYTARGGACIGAADFDGDGYVDIVCGSVNNYPYLVYYKNDGTMHFTRQTIAIPNAACTGPIGLSTKDLTGDGLPDIFGSTDAWNAGNQAHIWIMRNAGVKNGVVQWTWQCLNGCSPVIPPYYDTDILAPLDYDNDGDVDIILADANHSGDYYLVINMLADVFGLHGHAQSTNVTAGTLDPRQYAITSVRITSLVQGWRGKSNAGLKIDLFFSSNGGLDWELYNSWTGNGITTVTNSAADAGWYEFKNFGTDLRWRIVLTATEDPMQDYTGASFSTPRVFSLALEYKYVNRREYSRSSAAATIVTSSGETKKLTIGSSFIYPGWEGQLRAYDVTSVAVGIGGYSTLTTLTTSDLGSSTGRTVSGGTAIFWDAGQILASRSADDRKIYTAIRPGKVLSQPLQRTDFTAANEALLTPFLQDPNNDNKGLINFTRGTGRDWKLGDINHSTPVVIGPPYQVESLMGSGYSQFKTDNSNRTKVIYVGANDGMMHCFDGTTGAELWAFIPYNLLPKLQKQWAVDLVNADRYYAHDIFVDGSPVVADVQIAGVWKTVLVCGQGSGKGSTMAGGVDYYFALDVTDPNNPLPLWEITHFNASGQETMGETWSTPVIGKVSDAGTDRWVAFMGSGYDNIGQGVAGRSFYTVRVDTGEVIWNTTVTEVDTSLFVAPRTAYANIKAAIVGSPTLVDTDADGYVNSVYVGDLDGRLYRLGTTSSVLSSWTFTTLYTGYNNYPIITKPAVWIDPFSQAKTPKIYFGTGGDDNAPAAANYSFIALTDLGGTSGASVDWYIGNATSLNLTSDKKEGELGAGYKVWADPVVADFIVYFTTLPGSIENVNPCLNLGAAGQLYARQLRYTGGVPIGGSALRANGTNPDYLQMVSKARRAVTLGEIERTPAPESISKREVFLQEYNSTMEMLANPVAALLKIKSWREVYQVIR